MKNYSLGLRAVSKGLTNKHHHFCPKVANNVKSAFSNPLKASNLNSLLILPKPAYVLSLVELSRQPIFIYDIKTFYAISRQLKRRHHGIKT